MASLEETYPHITEWVDTWGWIEIGYDEGPLGFIRAVDQGGLIWDSDEHYATLDEAFQALEAALAEHMAEYQDDDEAE
jgi:hypothetical protein